MRWYCAMLSSTAQATKAVGWGIHGKHGLQTCSTTVVPRGNSSGVGGSRLPVLLNPRYPCFVLPLPAAVQSMPMVGHSGHCRQATHAAWNVNPSRRFHALRSRQQLLLPSCLRNLSRTKALGSDAGAASSPPAESAGTGLNIHSGDPSDAQQSVDQFRHHHSNGKGSPGHTHHNSSSSSSDADSHRRAQSPDPLDPRSPDHSGGHGDSHGHEHSHGAAHQLQHRATEKMTFKIMEKVAERMSEKMGERVTERLAERAGERLMERAGERVVERVGERAAERAGERLAERAAERAGERLAERAAERVGERLAERAAERTGERFAERAGERLAERAAERAGERLAERAGERLAERAGERVAERAAERAGERLAERVGERLAERAGERLAGRAGERVAERAAERAGERLAERAAERAVGAAADQASGHVAEQLVGRVGERLNQQLSQRAADRAAEQFVQRVGSGPAPLRSVLRRWWDGLLGRGGGKAGGRVGERAGEVLGERLLEVSGQRAVDGLGAAGGRAAGSASRRAAESAASHAAGAAGSRTVEAAGSHVLGAAGGHAAEAAASHAGAAAAGRAAVRGSGAAAVAHAGGAVAGHGNRAAPGLVDLVLDWVLGSKALARVVSPRLLARVGRGAVVALPAIGALFVAHLAHQDWHRRQQEVVAGNTWSSRAFLLAFVGDAMDVVAHLLVVAGLLHSHFQLGVHVSHALLHTVETGGLAVALVSTVAAMVGELLAVRALLQQERQKIKEEVEAAAAATVAGPGPAGAQDSMSSSSSSSTAATPAGTPHGVGAAAASFTTQEASSKLMVDSTRSVHTGAERLGGYMAAAGQGSQDDINSTAELQLEMPLASAGDDAELEGPGAHTTAWTEDVQLQGLPPGPMHSGQEELAAEWHWDTPVQQAAAAAPEAKAGPMAGDACTSSESTSPGAAGGVDTEGEADQVQYTGPCGVDGLSAGFAPLVQHSRAGPQQ